MPEHRGPRLKAGPLLDLLLEPDADPAEPARVPNGSPASR
jgi:hypothetical protein